MLRRQFRELARVRRFVYGQIPLRDASRIFEPGCGAGLVLEEVSALTDARLIGMDLDEGLLDEARMRVPRASLVRADFLDSRLPRADIVLLSHVLLHTLRPGSLVKRIARSLPRGGIAAVLGEYDWGGAVEDPPEGLLDVIRRSLAGDGLRLQTAAEIDGIFEEAGFVRVAGGRVPGSPSKPAPDFLSLQIPSMATGPHPGAEWTSRLVLPLIWGIYLRP
jgi:SAM-dependent methyltransferase